LTKKNLSDPPLPTQGEERTKTGQGGGDATDITGGEYEEKDEETPESHAGRHLKESKHEGASLGGGVANA